MDRTTDERTRMDDDVALDLQGLLAAVLRRLPFVLIVTALAAVGTFAILSMMNPRFTAETKILIESQDVRLTRDAADGAMIAVDDQAVASQVQLLTSRDLARRVAERMKLGDLAEFEGSRIGLLGQLLVSVGLSGDPMRISPEERVIDAFNEHLTVFPVTGSRVITVQFWSRDRRLAGEVANAVTDEYMRLQGEAKRKTSEEQTRWLGEEIDALRTRVREAEAAVERFRSGRDLFMGANDTTIAQQRLSDLTTEIAAAEADKAEAEARARQLRSVLNGGAALDAASDVLNSDTYRSLRSREIALRSRMSELLVTYLPGHPEVRTLQSQIDDIGGQLRAEARRVLSSLENDARAAKARIDELAVTLNQLKVASSRSNEDSVELRALEREATAQRDLLETMLTRYREAVARQNAETLPADARVISRAAMPVEPSFPRLAPMTTVAGLAGLLLAIIWVIAGEFLSGRALVRTPADRSPPRVVAGPSAPDPVLEDPGDEDVDAAARPAPETVARAETARPPSAASVAASAEDPVDPRVARFRERAGRALASFTAKGAGADLSTEPSGDEPDAPAETVAATGLAGLRTVLIADGASRVAMTGLGTAEDLEAVVAAFSRAAIRDGVRLVVVDAVAGRNGESVGLSDLFAGEADFEEIIRRNPVTRAHEIGFGRRPLDVDAAAGETMNGILSALERTYDMVVTDLGLLVEADALRLHMVRMADHVVLVGDPDHPRTAEAVDMLSRSGIERISLLSPDEADVEDAA